MSLRQGKGLGALICPMCGALPGLRLLAGDELVAARTRGGDLVRVAGSRTTTT